MKRRFRTPVSSQKKVKMEVLHFRSASGELPADGQSNLEYSFSSALSVYRLLRRPGIHERQKTLRISKISFCLQHGARCSFWLDVLRGELQLHLQSF